MAEALQRDQLNRLCSSSDTFEKAQSILRLANAKTRPGSGFVVKNPVAIPAVCAYLASEQLNTAEVSLHSAMSAACVSKTEFADILKRVRAALATEEENTVTNVTYETLADAYRVQSRDYAIACMEDVEAALPRVDMVKERYGAHVVLCAVFYWVCQLLEQPSVQERHLRQTYSIQPKTLKAVVTMLDKQCDGIADQIKSRFKSPKKSRVRSTAVASKTPPTLATTPSKKRTDDRVSFVDTPAKKRRVDFATPTKPKTSASPAKRSLGDSTAAFHSALQGSPAKVPTTQETQSPIAGPSTPRRPRHTRAVEALALVQDDAGPSPSRSQRQEALPTRPAVRRRFRPVFLEQQQWCARDPKVERLWAAAERLGTKMVELHGHPLSVR